MVNRMTRGALVAATLASLCLAANAAIVQKSQLTEAVRQKIYQVCPFDKGSLSIRFVRVPESASVAGKSCRITVVQQNPGRVLGRRAFEVWLLGQNGARRRYWVTADVSASLDVVVAARNIRRGESVGAQDVTLQRRVLDGYADRTPVLKIADVVGKALRRGVPKGRIITSDLLSEPALVKKGSVVTIVARVKSLSVSTIGIALKNGRQGEVVPVRNIGSRRTVYGIVEAEGRIRVLVNGQ